MTPPTDGKKKKKKKREDQRKTKGRPKGLLTVISHPLPTSIYISLKSKITRLKSWRIYPVRVLFTQGESSLMLKVATSLPFIFYKTIFVSGSTLKKSLKQPKRLGTLSALLTVISSDLDKCLVPGGHSKTKQKTPN